MNLSNQKALVLFSGGQDSTTCLAWALDRYHHVETVAFDYGQSHAVELDCRHKIREAISLRFPSWSGRLRQDHLVDLSVLGDLSDTALTREVEIKMEQSGLPNTFVPGRNIIFFTFAASIAYRRGLKILVGGVCETDYSGYPDCRDDTIKAVQLAINLGLDSRFVIETPLMWIDKAATWELARMLGGDDLVDLIVEDTHSCYRGERESRHKWGHLDEGGPKCLHCLSENAGVRKSSAIHPVDTHKISITKLANRVTPINLQTVPKIATRKTTKHGGTPSIHTFSLKGVENFFNRVDHYVIHAP